MESKFELLLQSPAPTDAVKEQERERMLNCGALEAGGGAARASAAGAGAV